jgi:hypothetical protein
MKGLQMTIEVKGYSFAKNVPVFRSKQVTVNGKPTVFTSNVNRKLDWNGNEFVFTKGTWSSEQREAFRGNY